MRKLSIALLLWMGLGALNCQAASPIVIMVGGIDKLIYLPAIVAQSRGYFAAQGLHVDLVSEPAGVNAEDELIAGAVQGVVGFYDHCIDLQSRGYALQSVIQLTTVPGEVELARAGTTGTDLAQLGGRRFGVTDLGSSTEFLTEYLASKAGLAPGSYRLVPVDAGERFIQALRSGRIDAGMTTDPTVARLMQTRAARILVDMRTVAGTRAALGGDYPAAALYLQRSWIEAHPHKVHGLVQALLRALRYLRSHDGTAIAAGLPRGMTPVNHALFAHAIDTFRPMYSGDGRMPVDGPPTVLRVLQTVTPDIRPGSVDLSKTYTERFLAP